MDLENNHIHSGTVIGEKFEGNSQIQLHWDGEEKEMIVLNNWWVANGPDDVDHEFEVLAKYTKVDEFINSPYFSLLNKVA